MEDKRDKKNEIKDKKIKNDIISQRYKKCL